MNKGRSFIVALAAFSLLLTGCNTVKPNSNSGSNSHNISMDGPNFVKWDEEIETERELWDSENQYQDIYITAIYNNPNQNEILSLTINNKSILLISL